MNIAVPEIQPISKRRRLRDLGLKIGRFLPGKYNAITDVKGVKVGHSTIISGPAQFEPTVRTGVTIILPNEDNVFMDRVFGGSYVLNGAGELSGLIQVQEWGLIETPIILTNSLSVGTCSEAVVEYMIQRYPQIGNKLDVILPLVGECDDAWLNDIAGQHVQSQHVFEAYENARSGPVPEGSVGGGTGMITCDFKAGIGTSSRKLHQRYGGYTIGVLVMTNFGEMNSLRFDGIPIGKLLAPYYSHLPKRTQNYGSIIAVIATDAPLLPHQLNRIAKRVSLGIGRVGSYAAHGSGEIILSFSTANKVPRESAKMVYRVKSLLEHRMNPIYEASIETTEEAILNALCVAEDMAGVQGHFSPAIPLDKLQDVISQYNKLFSQNEKR